MLVQTYALAFLLLLFNGLLIEYTSVATPSQPDAPVSRIDASQEQINSDDTSGSDTQAKHQIALLGQLIYSGIDGINEVFREIRGSFTFLSAVYTNFTSGGEWKEWARSSVEL